MKNRCECAGYTETIKKLGDIYDPALVEAYLGRTCAQLRTELHTLEEHERNSRERLTARSVSTKDTHGAISDTVYRMAFIIRIMRIKDCMRRRGS